MRLWFFAMVIELLLQGVARTEVSREIPFQYSDGLIWVKADLAGTTSPLNFLLDTGASMSAIDLQTAETHGIHLGDKQPVEGVNGFSSGYSVKGLRGTLGGNTLPTTLLAIDLSAINECCHQHIDGILGVDFFRGRIVRIDFNASKIYLLKSCDRNVANCEVLPIKMCNGAFCIPMRIAGNPAQWMRLDTGCDSAVVWALNGRERRQMSRASIGLTSASVNHMQTSVQLGSHTFNGIRASIHNKRIFPGEDGLLGNGLLSKFCLTIDERNRRVLFYDAH